MKIHEYQAKQILARYGVRIPRSEVAHTKEEARAAAEKFSAGAAGATGGDPVFSVVGRDAGQYRAFAVGTHYQTGFGKPQDSV